MHRLSDYHNFVRAYIPTYTTPPRKHALHHKYDIQYIRAVGAINTKETEMLLEGCDGAPVHEDDEDD